MIHTIEIDSFSSIEVNAYENEVYITVDGSGHGVTAMTKEQTLKVIGALVLAMLELEK